MNSDLFFAALGGLGQFGIITKARISLQLADSHVSAHRVVIVVKFLKTIQAEFTSNFWPRYLTSYIQVVRILGQTAKLLYLSVYIVCIVSDRRKMIYLEVIF